MGILLAAPHGALAGYSPVTHVSSDDCAEGNGPTPWYSHRQLNPLIDEEDMDPTDALDDDTAWPSENQEFSDMLFR